MSACVSFSLPFSLFLCLTHIHTLILSLFLFHSVLFFRLSTILLKKKEKKKQILWERSDREQILPCRLSSASFLSFFLSISSPPSVLLSFVYVSSSIGSGPRKLGAGPQHEVQRRRIGPVHGGRSSEARMHHRRQHRSRKAHRRGGEGRMHRSTRW